MIILDAKTDFSFMRGYGSPSQWRERAKAIGLTTLGIADYCSTWGHHPFRGAFDGSGINLLYGVQVPVVGSLDKDPRHSLVTLIAKESTDELYAIMSAAHQQTYYRPRLTWKQIGDLQDCFIIVNELLSHHVRAVPSYAFVGHKLLPSDAIASLTQHPKVLSYGPCYPNASDRQGFELLQAISSNHRLGEIECDDFHLLRAGEQREIFKPTAEMLANMERIATECRAVPPRGQLLRSGYHPDGLREMALAGAQRLGIFPLEQAYLDRLDLELKIINEKDFADYFFFVADIVSWAKERMFVGPGRGSAGGSLLCYLLGITTVDPLKFGTLFERFIDVTRSDLPDIDVDFPDSRRQEVFDYLRSKYGEDRVARLGTLTQFGGKSAFNAVARATNVPFDASREIGKFTEGSVQGQVYPPKWVMKHNANETEKILKRHPSLRLAALLDETETPDNDEKLPQHISHHGVHASGVIVTDEPCSKYGVVDRAGVLSMDMMTAEKIGLVKMDALGLRTLSVIQEACDLAKIDPKSLYDLDWADLDVFDRVFNADRVTGVFQFEGNTVRSLMRQIKVDRFDDLCALSSLARPGPLIGGAAAAWVKARNGEAPEAPIHAAMGDTYGNLTYQEQFMSLAKDIAGFDVASVNGMRKAVSKKDPAKLRSYRDAFLKGLCSMEQRFEAAGFVFTEEGRWQPHVSKDALEQGQELREPQKQGPQDYARSQRKDATGKVREAGPRNESVEGRSQRDDTGVSGRAISRDQYDGTPSDGVSDHGAKTDGPRARSSYGSEQEEQFTLEPFDLEQQRPQASSSRDQEGRGDGPKSLVGDPRNVFRRRFSLAEAEVLWDEISDFGSYAFVRAHAVEYGMISYMCAWLKLKYPLEFATAQLRNAADDDQIKALLRELTEEGYKYVPFDLRYSSHSWSILGDILYGGFDSIRGIGTKTAERLVAVRASCGDDPDGHEFLSRLTQAQRDRITKAELRWNSLSHFTENYGALYKDPSSWRGGEIGKGVRPPVYRIRDIPDQKGQYAFLGRVVKRNVVDDDAPERVAKRDGVKRGKDHQFINLTIEDDTGEIGATINRFKFEEFRWIAEDDITGKDFLFRGNVIEAGRKWLFLEKIKRISEV